MYLEDVDLAWRLRLAGYSARYVSAATVRHRYQGSSQRHGADFVGRHCRENRLPMLVKNASKRMLVRGLARTSLDLLRIAHRDGLPGLTRVAGACRAAVNDRREIRRLLRVSRRRVERDWARHR